MTTARRRIWITGIGIITAAGTGVDAFRAGLRRGRSPVARIDRDGAVGAHRIDDEPAAVPGDDRGNRRQRIQDAGAGLAVDQGGECVARARGEAAAATCAARRAAAM